jgi:3-phenylpropionate/trans-cinnamate dioxygenase ferredoxin component
VGKGTAVAQFVKVAKKSELPEHEGTLEEIEGKGTLVEVEGNRIALFNLDGEVYAIDDACTHEGGPLSEGTVQGDEVVCPWHGSRFSIVSGEARALPAMENVASYKVRVTGDDVEVEV